MVKWEDGEMVKKCAGHCRLISKTKAGSHLTSGDSADSAVFIDHQRVH